MVMRLLIYGAGVIGGLYASLFAQAGYEVSLYARGKRLESLRQQGLCYERKGQIYQADIEVIATLSDEERYDFIFLTVKENQVRQALAELAQNISPTIVTMVNTLIPYHEWASICGEGRLLPAFPGAGGSYQDGVLKAELTPRFMQVTTFGEIDGKPSARLGGLAGLFKSAKIPYQVVKDMQSWQLCHLAMVIPLADAYYQAICPQTVWRERAIMEETARQIQNNLQALYQLGMPLLPWQVRLMRQLPLGLFRLILKGLFASRLGETFMYQHAMKATDEMQDLHEQFYHDLKRQLEQC